MNFLLDPIQFSDARKALLDPHSSELIELMFRLNLRRSIEGVAGTAIATAVKLGWVQPGGQDLTPLGWLVADPIREYRFWLDRGRRVHGEADYELLAPERYSGKHVLEPGSGFGCNLLSLSRVPGRFVGLEPVALYRQFTPIFSEREGLPVPEVVDGKGEALPFPAETFDVVLCYSAHQYMDVRPALREMARVLKPGGQLQIIGGTLDAFASNMGGRLLRQPSLGSLKSYLLTIGNTLTYEVLGRRIFVPRGPAATTAPIYPRFSRMCRWMREDAGLQVRTELCRRIGVETCFVADKPF
jgi:SAM-dependent methyltransferase